MGYRQAWEYRLDFRPRHILNVDNMLVVLGSEDMQRFDPSSGQPLDPEPTSLTDLVGPSRDHVARRNPLGGFVVFSLGTASYGQEWASSDRRFRYREATSPLSLTWVQDDGGDYRATRRVLVGTQVEQQSYDTQYSWSYWRTSDTGLSGVPNASPGWSVQGFTFYSDMGVTNSGDAVVVNTFYSKVPTMLPAPWDPQSTRPAHDVTVINQYSSEGDLIKGAAGWSVTRRVRGPGYPTGDHDYVFLPASYGDRRGAATVTWNSARSESIVDQQPSDPSWEWHGDAGAWVPPVYVPEGHSPSANGKGSYVGVGPGYIAKLGLQVFDQ